MSDDFDHAFEIVIGLEGGYVNDPNDPGGETKYGIAKAAHPDVDIKSLTLGQAKDIYREGYWKLVRGDDLPWPINAIAFDGAVNQSPSRAIALLQKALGAAQDGILGRKTLAMLSGRGAPGSLALRELGREYLALRAIAYIGTRNFDRYGKGWFERLFRLASSVL